MPSRGGTSRYRRVRAIPVWVTTPATVQALKTLVEPGGARTIYAYDNAEFCTSTTYPGGVVITATPDQRRRTTRLPVQKSGGPKLVDLAYAYTFDASGADGTLVTSRTDASSAAVSAKGTGGVWQTYNYDTLNSLTRALETKVTGGTASSALRAAARPARS